MRPLWPFLGPLRGTTPGILALAMTAVLGGCATSDEVGGAAGPGSGPGGGQGGSGQGGAGDGGAPLPASGSGATVATSTTGSTTPGVTTGPTTSATSSSTGTPCEESPCKLLTPQCGCDVGDKCTIDGDGDRTCVADGTRAPGQECSASLGDCEAGALCVYVIDGGETLSCARFCETDAQCDGQGGVCALGLTGVDDAKLCSENCDLVSASGCAIAGTKCGLGYDDPGSRYFSLCVGSGAGVEQSICNGQTNQCAPGYDCFETSEGDGTTRCFKWCSSLAPGCPDGQSCLMNVFDPPIAIGNVTYGVCSA